MLSNSLLHKTLDKILKVLIDLIKTLNPDKDNFINYDILIPVINTKSIKVTILKLNDYKSIIPKTISHMQIFEHFYLNQCLKIEILGLDLDKDIDNKLNIYLEEDYNYLEKFMNGVVLWDLSYILKKLKGDYKEYHMSFQKLFYFIGLKLIKNCYKLKQIKKYGSIFVNSNIHDPLCIINNKLYSVYGLYNLAIKNIDNETYFPQDLNDFLINVRGDLVRTFKVNKKHETFRKLKQLISRRPFTRYEYIHNSILLNILLKFANIT